MTPLEEIAAERKRQVESEGWSAEHDDKHDHGEMRNAAAAYAMTPSARQVSKLNMYHGDTIRDRIWPWSREWWKPKDHRRDLVRAGALIIAEIERMNRQSLRGETSRLVYDKAQRTIVRDGEPLGISIEDTPLA